jgi:hypothetical protein
MKMARKKTTASTRRRATKGDARRRGTRHGEAAQHEAGAGNHFHFDSPEREAA